MIPLNTPTTIKLETTTQSGARVRVPATILATDARIEFLKSPFSLKDEIKAMKHAEWQGYKDPPRKIWTVENCQRNWFQLQVMMGENPYEWFDRPLQHFKYDRPLMGHQFDMSDAGLTYHYQLFGAEMGCIAGDAIVHVNRAGRGFAFCLSELCYKFHGGRSSGTTMRSDTRGRSWDLSIPTYVQGFKGDRIGLVKIQDVLYKGRREVVRVTLETKSLTLTPDHEVCIGAFRYGKFKPVQDLVIGDRVMVRLDDGVSDEVNSEVQALPSTLVKTTTRGMGYWLDKDGYIRIGGLKGHPRWGAHGVYEHLLVMEDLLGRPVQIGEEVHHKNKQRWDNRPSNLILCATKTDHMALHQNYKNLKCGCYVFECVTGIKDAGSIDVYDIQCEGPYHNFAANDIIVHNCGKTLSAIETMEKSGKKKWWWVGPRSGLYAIEREFKKWEISPNLEVELMTYEGLVKRMGMWKSGDPAPMGIVFDEISRCKTAKTQRTQAAQAIADGVRADWGLEGYVLGMSGTPSPKSPVDWWAPTEIIWPGFLREGDSNAFKFRLGIHKKEESAMGNAFWQLVDWRDDERKCDVCGEFKEEGMHSCRIGTDLNGTESDIHDFKASINEVAYLNERLKGLVIVKLKKDCLDLPEKQYRQVFCKPSPATVRVAEALMKSAPNTITGLTRLRELSDGFQYRDKVVGKETCPICKGTCLNTYWVDPEDSERAFTMTDMLDAEYVSTLIQTEMPCVSCNGTGEVAKIERQVKEVPCPKEAELINLLDENEETGRLVVFAGFTGSIDRVTNVCMKQGWDVIRVDGRGWLTFKADGETTAEAPLDYWADVVNHPRVVFVAHPKSGGMALTLTESRMICFYSNDYNPESRSQAEDRIHRPGMDINRGATIVDLLHLPTDLKVLEILKANRRLELMSLGEFQGCFQDVEA